MLVRTKADPHTNTVAGQRLGKAAGGMAAPTAVKQ